MYAHVFAIACMCVCACLVMLNDVCACVLCPCMDVINFRTAFFLGVGRGKTHKTIYSSAVRCRYDCDCISLNFHFCDSIIIIQALMPIICVSV